MTAATYPGSYVLTDDGGPARPGWRYVLHRDGVRVATVYRETDGTYTAHGWHYLLALPATGPAGPGQTGPPHPAHRELVADTADAAAAMLATLADVLDTLARELAPYRDTAAAWHGGQSSALYALASSGTVVEPWQLAREAARADRLAWEAETGDDVPPDAYELAAIHALATRAADTLDSLTDGGPA
jgi:hypothetical protein